MASLYPDNNPYKCCTSSNFLPGWIEATAAPLAISYLVSFAVDALYILFFSRFSSTSVPGNFLFSGLPGTAFLFHFSWNIFMKSYAGNWQINRNSRNWMLEKILSERIPLNGQWNNRTSPTWPETRHGREGRSLTSLFFVFFYKIDEIKWQQYRTIGPEIQGFLSHRRSFYQTCPTVFRFHWCIWMLVHLQPTFKTIGT